jgi:subtilase family serine protease
MGRIRTVARILALGALPLAGLAWSTSEALASSKPVCPGPSAPGGARCFAHVLTDPHGNPSATTTPSGYGPAQFHGAYGLPSTYPSTAPAQTIGIVDAYDDPTIRNDLSVYDSSFKIPDLPTCASPGSTGACFVKVNQNGVAGSYPSKNAGWALEIALDVETAHEICQNCKIALVEANSSQGSNLDAAEDEAYKLGATEISNSWGTSGEYSGEVAENSSHFNHPGVAITVASGDNGYGAFGFPAASANVIDAGGTKLGVTEQSNGTYTWASETTWSGAGSGCSNYFSAQSWQTLLSDWPSTGCQSARGVADVAADADPNTGAAVYDTTKYQGLSGWYPVGGTSLASPLIAAVYALAGNAATRSYPASLPYSNSSSLHDVTTGPSTGSCATIMCNAATGYDGPTGVGTPNGLGAF